MFGHFALYPQIVCLSSRMLKAVKVFIVLQYSKCNVDFNYVYIFS